MSSAKLVFVFALQALCALAIPTNMDHGELLQNYLKEVTKQKWETQKVDALYEIVKRMMNCGNVTIVGWQLIHDDTGVKEIKTMELVLRNEMKTDKGKIQKYKDTDEELMEQLPYLLNTMKSIKSESGVMMMGTTQTWDMYGNLDSMIYMDDKDIYVMGDYNEIYMMRNITKKNMETVKDMALKLETNMPIAILTWNSDKTFNEKESVIVPELMSNVRSNTDATPTMMSEALKYLSEGYFIHPDTYLKYIKDKMTKSFPEYHWIVIKGHDGSYTNRNVFMGLEFHVTDLTDDSLMVDIFGIKKD